MIDDRESMHDTWHNWHIAFEKTKRDFINQGFMVVDIVMDLDKITDYCKLRKVINYGKARSFLFVQTK
jgi:hypothetical protein